MALNLSYSTMKEQHCGINLYPEALRLFKSKITDKEKIRKLLSLQNPNEENAIEEAIERLDAYRKSTALKFLLLSLIILPLGILSAALLFDYAGIIEMVIIVLCIGIGIGLLAKGVTEFFKVD